MANILYRKQKQQVSYDNGITWIDTGEYRVGDILENPSNCTSDDSKQCRWVELDASEGYYCDGTSKYTAIAEECTENGIIWTRTGNQQKGSTFIESNSCDCGYTEYKWNLIEGRYACGTEDFKKYGVEVYQIGCGGKWTNAEPYQERITEEPIECYSTDCGMLSNEIVVTYFADEEEERKQFIYVKWRDKDYEYCSFPTHGSSLDYLEEWRITQMGENTFTFNLNDFPCDIDAITVAYENAHTDRTFVKIIGIDKYVDTYYSKNLSELFMYTPFAKGAYVNLEHMRTDNAKSFNSMFQGQSTLTEIIGIENLNTSNVESMGYMFMYCSGLTSLDLSNWDTSKVGNMTHMFENCSGLRSLNLRGWDFSNILKPHYDCDYGGGNEFTGGTMNFMFSGLQDCEINLQDIKYDIYTISSSWNFIESEGLRDVFDGCNNVTLNMLGCDSTIVGCFEMMINANDVRIITDAVFNDGSNVLIGYAVSSFGDRGDITINGETVSLDDYVTTIGNGPTLISIDMNTNYNPLTSLRDLNAFEGIVNFPDTSNLTSMESMFTSSRITNFPKGLFNDISNVQSMNFMYYKCGKIFEVDMSGLNAPKLTEVESMFQECSSLETVDLSGWNATALTKSNHMFYNCYNLKNVNLSGWNATGLTNTNYMFRGCSSLETIDLSGMKATSIIDTSGMFNGCSSLKTIDLSGWDFSNVDITNLSSFMFSGCTSLEEIILNDVSCETYNKIADRLLYEGRIHVKITTNIAVDDCSSNMLDEAFSSDIFIILEKGTSSSNSVKINNVNYSLNNFGRSQWLNIEDTDINEITSLSYFNQNISYKYGSVINLNLDTSKVGDMSYMFENCSGLTSLDLSSFDTSNVTNMSYMFESCYSLTELDLSSFDTSNVTNMFGMFLTCSGLTELDLSNFNTSAVTDMYGMFENCSSLQTLNVSSWDVSQITSYDFMFYGCSALTSLDLSSFDTSNATSMYNIFYNCSSLQTLNVSSWDVSNITTYENMFYYCPSLTSLIVKSGTEDWWLARLTDAGIQDNVTITSV